MRRGSFPLSIAAALVLASCGEAPGPEVVTKAFFDQATGGKAPEAYESAAFGFKAQQSAKFFETMLHELGLDAVIEASYGAPEFVDDGRSARVLADFKTKAGPKVPLVVTLTREDGAWKVFSLKSPRDAKTGIV